MQWLSLQLCNVHVYCRTCLLAFGGNQWSLQQQRRSGGDNENSYVVTVFHCNGSFVHVILLFVLLVIFFLPPFFVKTLSIPLVLVFIFFVVLSCPHCFLPLHVIVGLISCQNIHVQYLKCITSLILCKCMSLKMIFIFTHLRRMCKRRGHIFSVIQSFDYLAIFHFRIGHFSVSYVFSVLFFFNSHLQLCRIDLKRWRTIRFFFSFF